MQAPRFVFALPFASVFVYCALFITASLASIHQAHAFFDKQWPSIESPPGSKAAWVADDMVQNGVPMRIKHFVSDMPAAAVVSHYKKSWQKAIGKKKPAINNIGDWTVIGYAQNDFLMTVQVRDIKSGSEGFMAVSQLPKAIADNTIAFDQDFPRPPGTTVMSDTRSRDMNKKGKTLILENSNSVISNVAFYKRKMKANGWSLGKYGDEMFRTDSSAAYLFFRRNKEACTITVVRSVNKIGSTIVANVANVSL